jgi:energy-coupling factor transport system substrate-specific component
MPTQNATLRLGRRERIALLAGILLYAAATYLTNVPQFSNAFGTDIRPAVAIPMFFGFVFGPIVGFGTGALGNFLHDVIAYGVPQNPQALADGNLILAFYLNWQIGNGLLGLIPGIMALYHRRYYSLGDLLHACVYIVTAVIVGIGFAALVDIPVAGWTFQQTLQDQFQPIVRHNLLNSLVIVPILLYNYARLDLKSINWTASGLLRRFLVAIFMSALVPTVLLGYFLIQQGNSIGTTVIVQIGFVAFVTLLFTIVSAALMAQSLLRPLLKLTSAAAQMQAGKLSRERAAELRDTPVTDEVGQLSSLFGKMAEQVIEREVTLKRQVESLRIEIDQVKQSKQVSEITDNEFFRDLQSKARTLRQRETRVGLAFTEDVQVTATAENPVVEAAEQSGTDVDDTMDALKSAKKPLIDAGSA